VAVADLETPTSADSLYTAVGDDTAELALRSLFTGDVLSLPSGDSVVLLQHPCSMRKGAEYRPKLLVGGVELLADKPRSDWRKAPVAQMHLLSCPPSKNSVASFEDLDTISSNLAQTCHRRAILSMDGVALLMQRWIYYSTRLIVPTITLAEVFVGPFEEADLTAEATETLIQRGWELDAASRTIDQWLSETEPDAASTRRNLLADPRARSTIRRQLRAHVRVCDLHD